MSSTWNRFSCLLAACGVALGAGPAAADHGHLSNETTRFGIAPQDLGWLEVHTKQVAKDAAKVEKDFGRIRKRFRADGDPKALAKAASIASDADLRAAIERLAQDGPRLRRFLVDVQKWPALYEKHFGYRRSIVAQQCFGRRTYDLTLTGCGEHRLKRIDIGVRPAQGSGNEDRWGYIVPVSGSMLLHLFCSLTPGKSYVAEYYVDTDGNGTHTPGEPFWRTAVPAGTQSLDQAASCRAPRATGKPFWIK
jgi:hypothetical protein